ncbi:TonB-dependent siderophore receptor [Arenimonas sp.]|uniref:TonB-dependent receptor n=1 Tax=Arenimonas sp. TaxID=1872635 RepID=UPI0025BF3E44|nr:TonB-dependent siderophore receptor [Arenimonas sp.]
MPRSLRCTPLAAALALALSAPAWAVTAPHVTELDTLNVYGQRDGYRAESTVTATKTETGLRDVPQAITVVTQEAIQDQAMNSLTDVLRLVPGVGVAQGEGHRDAPIFRGNTSTSDMFVDGIRDDVQYIRDLYNVERVEVLKGPNAMIFGRGGVGGIINRVSKQADGDAHRSLSLQVGDWNRRRAVVDIGEPMGAEASVRVTGLYEDSESFRDGFELERSGINPTVNFAAGEATRVTLGYEYFRDHRVADRGVPSLLGVGIGRPVDVPSDTFFGSPELSPIRASVSAFSALVEHEFDNGVSLRNRTRYGDYDRFYQNVYPNGVVADGGGNLSAIIAAYNNSMKRENLFNQTDLVWNFSHGGVRHTVLVGAEFGRQQTDNLRQSGTFTQSNLVPLENPRYAGGVTFANRASDANNRSDADVASLYVQDQIEFSPQWQAVLGLRHDRFEVDVRDNRTGAVLSSSDGLWSPRLGLIWTPVAPLSLYASYSTAALPRAGEQLSSLSSTSASLDPEEFHNYEIGAKWDVSPGLALTAAIYRLDRTNVFTVDPLDNSKALLVDGQRSTGLELGLAGEITDAWKILASYAYQDGEILSDLRTSATSVTPAGTRLAQLPRHSAAIWNRYDVTPRWGLGLGVVHRGEVFSTISNDVTLDAYTRVDAAVYYAASKNVKLQVNIENLLDTEYFASAHNDNNLMPGSPRGIQFGVNLDF